MDAARDSPAEVPGFAFPTSELTCPACVACVDCGERYVDQSLGAAKVASNAELVSDTLGFCTGHGAFLSDAYRSHGPLGSVLSAAATRWSGFMADEPRYGERIEYLFFHAGEDCPACRYTHHRAAAVTGRVEREFLRGGGAERLRGLCFPHFRSLYADAATESRELLLGAYASAFVAGVAAITGRVAEVSDPLDTQWIAPEGIGRLLRLVADEPSRRMSSIDADGVAPDNRVDGLQWLGDASSCPVCVSKNEAHRRWIDAVRGTVRMGQPLWLSLPTCPVHVWEASSCADADTAAAAGQYAAAVAVKSLEQRLWPFARAEDTGERPIERERRLRRENRGSGVPGRKRFKRPPRCRACEQLAVAENAAVDRLLDLLGQPRYRDALSRGRGPCMRHFSQLYIYARGLRLRQYLREMQISKLNDIHDALESAGPGNVRADACSRALAMFGAAFKGVASAMFRST